MSYLGRLHAFGDVAELADRVFEALAAADEKLDSRNARWLER